MCLMKTLETALEKRYVLSYIVRLSRGHTDIVQDPYFETVQARDADGRPYGKKRKQKKPVPEGISAHDAKVLTKVKRRAYRLDNAISICGIRFGWSSIIGFIPAAGDFVDFFMAWMVINSAKKVEGGLDKSVESKMWLNVMIDFAIGLVPFLGDFADGRYRKNPHARECISIKIDTN